MTEWLRHPHYVVHPVYMHGTPGEAAQLQLASLIAAMTARLHHGTAPASTQTAATATPQSQPASAARLSADDTE